MYTLPYLDFGKGKPGMFFRSMAMAMAFVASSHIMTVPLFACVRSVGKQCMYSKV
jgi:hypothetical protein